MANQVNLSVVDPTVSDQDIRMGLRNCALALVFNGFMAEKYYCDHDSACELFYLPAEDMRRLESDEESQKMQRGYAHGAIICLRHTTMWPATPEEEENYKTGKLKHVWLEMRDRREIESNTALDKRLR